MATSKTNRTLALIANLCPPPRKPRLLPASFLTLMDKLCPPEEADYWWTRAAWEERNAKTARKD